MGPAPYDVLVVAYAPDAFSQPAYAVFRQIGDAQGGWHVLSGCGGRGEQPPDAARRYARRAGMMPGAPFTALDTRATVRVTRRGRAIEIPQHAFAAVLHPDHLRAPDGHEHSWVTYDVACGLVRHRPALDALWELRRRLGRRAAGISV